MNQQQSGIQVHTGFFPLAFILYICTPRLQIDGGQPIMRPWGDTFIPVAPGRHTVRCWFRYVVFETCGDATTTVDVAPGQVVALTYKAPIWLVFMSGKWEFTAQAITSGAPAGAIQGPMQAVQAGPAYAAPVAPVAPGQGAPAAPVSTPAAPPADWYPDPYGRHQLRFWNGAAWSEHVSDNGVTSVEPPQ